MSLLPLDIDYLTDDIIKKAENELRETPEMKKEALIKLRKLMKEDTKLAGVPNDDRYLLQFLRPRKFDAKRTLNLLHNYYYVKKHNTDVFQPDFEGWLKAIDQEIISVMPYRDEDGCFICILKLHKWDVNEMQFTSILHAIACSAIACVDLYPASQICGLKCIIDAKNLGLNYIRYISLKQIHLVATGLTNSLQIRFKAIHVYNESPFMHHIWSVIKFALTEKIRNRVRFHSSSVEGLHKDINPAVLPEEYGGNLQYDKNFFHKIVSDDFTLERYNELMSVDYKVRKK